jgi:hypothetical protein
MQTNFEKKIKEKLHDFRVEPSFHVWKDISASLEEPEKRRAIAWRIFAGSFAFIIVIAGAVWMSDHNSSLHEKNNVAAKKTVNKFQKSDIITKTNSSAHYSIQNNILSDEDYSTQKKSAAPYAYPIARQKQIAVAIKYSSADKNLIASPDQNNIPNVVDQKNIASLSVIPSSENTIAEDKTFLSKNNPSLSEVKSNTPVLNNIIENKIASTDLQKNNIVPQKTATVWSVKKIKRSLWSFVFGGGSTNTVDRNMFLRKSKPLIYTNSAGKSDTVKNMRPAYIGFHVTGGVQYSFAFNKHWTLFSGLQYSFLLNHQRTGINVNQTSEISNAADTLNKSQQYFKILSHFINGVIDVNTNTASWLEAPVSFGYKINPRSKVTLELRAGASFTHMFADRWLIPDGRYDKFYYSNELTNNYIVCAHEDIVLTLPKHKLVGLQFQHSITSLGKNAVQPAVYWSNMSLYTTIPLK